jgi:hypothetical protein
MSGTGKASIVAKLQITREQEILLLAYTLEEDAAHIEMHESGGATLHTDMQGGRRLERALKRAEDLQRKFTPTPDP